MSTRRRMIPWWIAVIAFVVIPLVEIYTLIQVGQVIGAWPTIGLLILDSVIGAWLIKREGRKAWGALQEALSAGRMPARELADGALILIAGTLMLTPGFLSDVFGILMIVPFTRPLFRGVLTTVVARRLTTVNPLAGDLSGFAGFGVPTDGGTTNNRPGPRPKGPVVQGEVIDPEERSG